MLTPEQFKEVLPAQMKGSVNQIIIDKINDTLSNPDTMEMLRDNLIGYTSVMQQGKFKVANYIDAVKYVSYKVMGDTNLNAYIRTFPDKHADFVARGVAPKDIASYITAYNKSKLVNLIYEQTLVPVHILNADLFQKAINTQAQIMLDEDVSAKVRTEAANSLMTHLKRPETKKIELDITHKEDSAISLLREQTAKLVEQQRQGIATGQVKPEDAVNTPLVLEAEFEETTVTKPPVTISSGLFD